MSELLCIQLYLRHLPIFQHLSSLIPRPIFNFRRVNHNSWVFWPFPWFSLELRNFAILSVRSINCYCKLILVLMFLSCLRVLIFLLGYLIYCLLLVWFYLLTWNLWVDTETGWFITCLVGRAIKHKINLRKLQLF